MTTPILVGRFVPPVVQFAWVVDGAVVDADLTVPADSLEAARAILESLKVPEFPVIPGPVRPYWAQYLEEIC